MEEQKEQKSTKNKSLNNFGAVFGKIIPTLHKPKRLRTKTNLNSFD